MEDAHQIADLLKFAIPFIIMYNAYIHNQVIKNAKDIAVNNANDKNKEKEYKKIYDLVEGLSKKIEGMNELLIRLEEAEKHK